MFFYEGDVIDFQVHRVPFFLEPGYMAKPDNWTEPHNTRMVRKFGSMEAFERVKKAHGLIPRGAEVGLDKSCGSGSHDSTLHKQITTTCSSVAFPTIPQFLILKFYQVSTNHSSTNASKAQLWDRTDWSSMWPIASDWTQVRSCMRSLIDDISQRLVFSTIANFSRSLCRY